MTEFLNYIALGGSIVTLSWLLTFFPKWEKWHPKNPQVKKLAFFGIASIFSLFAWGLLVYAPEVVVTLTPPFMIVAAIFSILFLGDAAHKIDPFRKPPVFPDEKSIFDNMRNG